MNNNIKGIYSVYGAKIIDTDFLTRYIDDMEKESIEDWEKFEKKYDRLYREPLRF